jgi:membrane-bound lytic murein transglycosylase A
MVRIVLGLGIGWCVRAAAILGLLAGCAGPGGGDLAVVESRSPSPVTGAAPPSGPTPSPSSTTAPADEAGVAAAVPRATPKSRWAAVAWAELPGWQGDAPLDGWLALTRGCARPTAVWLALCRQAQAIDPLDESARRDWLLTRLRPYRIEAGDGSLQGLLTGYFEPEVAASRIADSRRRFPLYAAPADLAQRKPYWTRQQIDTEPAARAALRAIAYVADPLDALLLQIQGSGRLLLADELGGQSRVRIAFAAHNDQPYQSVGRWLIAQGELSAASASWPAIRDWARRHPERVNELLWSNPRYVFFREEALPDPAVGPRGAQGVALTGGRSLAVDPQSVPYGTPLWLDAIDPRDGSPLRRLAMAQDTGGAITGAVRADLFCGWGEAAEALAGRLRSPLRLWALWPADAAPPVASMR